MISRPAWRWWLLMGAFVCLSGGAYAQAPFRISSPAFAPGQALPATCAHAHGNLSPALRIAGVPARAQSLALMIVDPDAPSGLFAHWLLWNIPPETTSIPPGAVPPGAVQGKNGFGDIHYDGPAPPHGTHRYLFHLYALDTTLALPPGSDRAALLGAMKGHVVARTETMGTYAAPR